MSDKSKTILSADGEQAVHDAVNVLNEQLVEHKKTATTQLGQANALVADGKYSEAKVVIAEASKSIVKASNIDGVIRGLLGLLSVVLICVVIDLAV